MLLSTARTNLPSFTYSTCNISVYSSCSGVSVNAGLLGRSRAAMSSKFQVVVQGEASETDSDDEVYITSLPAPQYARLGAKVLLVCFRVKSVSSKAQLFAHTEFTVCFACDLGCS